MEITGKIKTVLPLQSGEGKNGTWRKQEYILETNNSKYPKDICFSVWNDKIEDYSINVSQELKISIDIESREFNGKWYTNVQAWNVEKFSEISDKSVNNIDNIF